MCIPFLVTTFPEWLSGTEPCGTHPAPCVRLRCVCSVLRAHVQFCRFDKADATADVQWHCNHRPPLWYHYFPAQSSLGADILVYWIGKNRSNMCSRWESNPRLPACKANTLFTRPGSPGITSCVCVYSNSRKDVPRVAQRYGTIAAHTRRRASVLIVYVMFCVHVYSFAGLLRCCCVPILLTASPHPRTSAELTKFPDSPCAVGGKWLWEKKWLCEFRIIHFIVVLPIAILQGKGEKRGKNHSLTASTVYRLSVRGWRSYPLLKHLWMIRLWSFPFFKTDDWFQFRLTVF